MSDRCDRRCRVTRVELTKLAPDDDDGKADVVVSAHVRDDHEVVGDGAKE